MSTTPAVVDTSKRVILDYTSRDYKAIRSMLVGLAEGLMPDWETVGETGDFGTLLLELYAYTGDIMNYYIDRTASEAFLGTAVRRQSVLYIADMFGYQPMGQRAATVPVAFTWQWDTNNLPGGLVPVTTYTVVSASATNGVVTMGLTSDVFTIAVLPGQTITVAGVGVPYDGRFVVRSTQDASHDTPFQVTYLVTDLALSTAVISGTPTVETGAVVVLPAKTQVSTAPDSDGQVFTFETDTEITLDTAVGDPTAPGSSIYTVSFQGTATEGTSLDPYLVGTSQGIPNAEFVISDPGVVDRTIQVFTKEGGAVLAWASVEKMALASPTQSVFVSYVDDQNFTHILFGDNTSGRIPPVNVEIYVGYRFGAGQAANGLGVGTINNISNDFATSLGVTVTNSAPPSGGADVESPESMRFSIPRSTALKQRAVTLEDFINLALQVPGVTKATAYGANYTTVYVRICASAASVGYVTTPVTGKYALNRGTSPALAVVTLENGFSLIPGVNFFLDHLDPPAAFAGTVQSTDIWLAGPQKTITAATQALTTVTITALAHGFLPNQPVEISGMGSPFDGVQVISSVLVDQFSYEVPGSGSASIVVDGTATPVPGFSFDADPATASIPWTAAESDSSATSVDLSMQELINSTEAYLDDKKLIGSVVYAEPVEWTDTDVACNVQVRPLYNRTSVQGAVQAAIEDVFAYANVDFGRRISIGDVYRAALSVDGVDYITLRRLAETTGFDHNVVKDINSTDDYVLTITAAEVLGATLTLTTFETVNLKIGATVELVLPAPFDIYDGPQIVTGVPSATIFTVTVPATAPTGLDTVDGTATMANHLNAFRIPRINPLLPVGWVTANGGLANT